MIEKTILINMQARNIRMKHRYKALYPFESTTLGNVYRDDLITRDQFINLSILERPLFTDLYPEYNDFKKTTPFIEDPKYTAYETVERFTPTPVEKKEYIGNVMEDLDDYFVTEKEVKAAMDRIFDARGKFKKNPDLTYITTKKSYNRTNRQTNYYNNAEMWD